MVETVTGSKLGNVYVIQGVLQNQIDRTTEACRSFKRALDLASGTSLQLAEAMAGQLKCAK